MNFTSILIYGIYQCKWDQFASIHDRTPDSYSLRKILMVWRYKFSICNKFSSIFTSLCKNNYLLVHSSEWAAIAFWWNNLGTLALLFKNHQTLVLHYPHWSHQCTPFDFGDCTQMVKHWPIRPSDFALTISLWSLYMCIWTLHLKYKILDNIH